MQIWTFQLGPLGANCYIVADEETKACAVVDPGGHGDKVAQWLREQGLKPRYVLLTHGPCGRRGEAHAPVSRPAGLSP